MGDHYSQAIPKSLVNFVNSENDAWPRLQLLAAVEI
jgi:hypothetical protein